MAEHALALSAILGLFFAAGIQVGAPPLFRLMGGRGPVLVSFGDPYQIRQLPELRSYVVAWGPAPVSQAAAARASSRRRACFHRFISS